MNISLAQIENAKSPTPWDFGNEVLYSLCRNHPTHSNSSIVIGKVWLVGRSYAAAIERRRNITEPQSDFYVDSVAPAIVTSGIDTWLTSTSVHEVTTDQNLPDILSVHSNVTQLFNKISGLDKRSLASKYLHFHQPNLYYIYDSRAVRGLSKFSNLIGRATRDTGSSDNEYRKFAEKCLRLQIYIKKHFDISLTPREIDNLLLG